MNGLARLVSKNPMAIAAADAVERAQKDAAQAADPGLMAAAQIDATAALAMAVLSLEVQLDRVVSRIEAALAEDKP